MRKMLAKKKKVFTAGLPDVRCRIIWSHKTLPPLRSIFADLRQIQSPSVTVADRGRDWSCFTVPLEYVTRCCTDGVSLVIDLSVTRGYLC